MGRWDSLHGLAPSQGILPVTHWSQACLEVVARHAATPPLRRWLGAVVTGGFSDAWHLLIWRESRSLCAPSLMSDGAHVDGRRRALTCARTGRRSADTCRADRPCLDRAGEQARSGDQEERTPRGRREQGGVSPPLRWRASPTVHARRRAWKQNSRERMWRATCCGRVKVAWHTGHLWSPAMVFWRSCVKSFGEDAEGEGSR
jgi:hypothetical protein